MKSHFAVFGIVVLLLLGGVGMAEEKKAVWSSFGFEDIRAMKRAMKAFFCEGGPSSEGKVDFFVLRGRGRRCAVTGFAGGTGWPRGGLHRPVPVWRSCAPGAVYGGQSPGFSRRVSPGGTQTLGSMHW